MNQKKDKVQWRRSKVQELLVKGYNHYEIASTLQISRPTITSDIQYLSQCAKKNIRKYIDERLPEEYEKCLVGLNAILREAWNTPHQTEDKREKIQALSLTKECYSMKLDLLTNATVVDDAIRFVTDKQQYKETERKTSFSQSKDNGKESVGPDYNEEDSDIQSKEKQQEEEVGEIRSTTNLVF